jgi:hypothetical protein
MIILPGGYPGSIEETEEMKNHNLEASGFDDKRSSDPSSQRG